MKNRFALCLLWAVVVSAICAPVVSAQETDVLKVPSRGAASSEKQETDVLNALRRGDATFEKNDYPGAIVAYFEAAALSTVPANLSRAYFGLSLCYFYQRDMAESVKWMRKVALVDINKQITTDSYPKPFVDLFTQVLAEARTKGTPVVSNERVQAPPVKTKPEEPAKLVEVPAQKGEQKKEELKKEEPQKEEMRPVIPPIETSFQEGFWERMQGRFEISVHVSGWTLNPLTGILKSDINDGLGEAIQSAINDELNDRYSGLVKGAFTSDLSLDTTGSNYGFEIRYYVRGRAGTFSLGFSLEQTNIKFSLAGTARQEFSNTGVADVTATAEVETKPFSTNMSFRWEIGAPTARVKPYITFGLGLAPLKGTFRYTFVGTYSLAGAQESIEDSQTKDFEALSEDIDFKIPKLFVIVQLHFGLKIELFNGLFIQGEAGLWDGLAYRGGLGYRF